MDKILHIFTYTDGINDKPFPNKEIQITVSDFTYTSQRMGSVTLTASVMCELCLDNLWNGKQYIIFSGERYFITNVPTSSKDNEDTRYKHELEFRSNRAILDNVYFFDVVTSEVSVDRYSSNSTNVVFHGDVHEFAARLNASMKYSGLEYRVYLDEGITSEPKMVSLSSAFISDALQEIFNQYDLPYYFVGKEIHIGFTNNAINYTFKYGVNESLLSISKNNSNYRKINLCSGEGSADNIPFYYPNKTQKGTVGLEVGESNVSIKKENVSIVDSVKYADSIDLNQSVIYGYGSDYTESKIYKGFYSEVFYNKESATIALYGKQNQDDEQTIRSYYETRIRFKCDRESNIKLSLNVTTDEHSEYSRYQAKLVEVDSREYFAFDLVNEGAVVPKGTYDILIGYNIWDDSLNGYWWQDPIDDRIYEWLPDSRYSPFRLEYDLVVESEGWLLNNRKIELSDIGIEVNAEPTIGDSFYQTKTGWVIPYQKLLPSIYRESLGAERFYPALNDTYISPDTGEYYEFENEFNGTNNSELIVSFDDIRPTIVGIENADKLPIDEIIDVAFDLEDSDEVDEDGNYLHPYFFVKLRKTNGSFGFNLFDSAIVASDMYLELTSGNCSAGKFLIGVDADSLKNPVQVDDSGNLKRDSKGDVLWDNQPIQSRQNDTLNNEVWIALTKDNTTFGSVIPNATFNYKPSVGDKFVLTGIHLPESYILSAEDRLEKAIIKYMAENNSDKFTFSINFSRIFLAENPEILAQLNENARLLVDYNGTLYTLYITSYTYKANDSDILPEINVELSDTITVNRSVLETSIDAVKQDIMSTIGSNDFLKQGLKYFIRKDIDDVANGVVTFRKEQIFKEGFKVGDDSGINADGDASVNSIKSNSYEAGTFGGGFSADSNGRIEAQSLVLHESLEVPEIRFNQIRVYTGIDWQTFGGGVIESVEIDRDENGNELQSGIITLNLVDSGYGYIALDDLTMGIWHNLGDNDDTDIDYRNGNFRFKGFSTVYFRITEILDTATNGRFRYALRGMNTNWKQQHHPRANMHFACYANPTNKDRQSCSYSTTEYSIRLENMTTWEYGSANIYDIRGKLDGFSMNGKEFKGNGSVQGNTYIYGFIDQFERIVDRMTFDLQGDNMVAEGEVKSIQAIIMDGYNRNVNANYTDWKITRETGNQASDNIWNATAKIVDGLFQVSWTRESDDFSGSNTALFIVSATRISDDWQTISIIKL